MDQISPKKDINLQSRLRTWWAGHYTLVLCLSAVFMGIIFFLRWKYELHRLLFETSHNGAIDLGKRFFEVSQWFAGNPVSGSVYPPASYVILWPFLGWLDFTSARWLWTFTMLGALTWLIIIVVRESLAKTFLERLFLILLILSMNSTSVTIGNGQLGIHILPLLIYGLLMIQMDQKTWLMDLIISLLILFCLVKPSFTAPFFWILLCKRKGLRPAVMIIVMYVFLNLFAVSFQGIGISVLTKKLASTSIRGALASKWGYANLHQWMNGIGLGKWTPYASLSVLFLLGFWLYQHRNKDLWLLMGVTAIISRIWTYHALYDDILILIPVVAVFRIAKQGTFQGGKDVKACILLVMSWFSMLSPARLLIFPPPWNLMFKTGQTIVWFAILVFLLNQTTWSSQKELGSTKI